MAALGGLPMWRLFVEARHFPRSFQLLAAGQSVSVFGTLMVGIAFDLFVLHKTGSALQFSFMLSVQLVGPILFGPVMGEWIDVLKKKSLLMGLDAGRGLVSLSLCVLLLRGGSLSMGVVYSLVGFYAACEAMFDPAVAAIIPRLVDEAHLAEANTVYGALADVSYALGPALGAVAYGGIGLTGVLAVDAATYGAAVLCEAAITLAEDRLATVRPHFLKSYARGFRLVWGHGPVKYLVVNDMLNHLFLFPFLSVVLPYVIIRVWHGPNWAYGLVGFIATGGSIASTAVSAHWDRRDAVLRNVSRGFWVLTAFALFLIPFLWPGPWRTLGHLGGPWIAGYWGGANFELYLGFAIYLAFSTTWIQSVLPDEALGRFFASRGTIQASARLLGVLLYGVFLENFPPEVSVALLVAAIVANAVIHRLYVAGVGENAAARTMDTRNP